jgi:hypothetical protein
MDGTHGRVAASVNRVESAERLRDLLEQMLTTLAEWRAAIQAEHAAEKASRDPSQPKLFLLEYYLRWIDGLTADLEGRVLDQLMELFNVIRTAYHEAVLEKRAGKP